jgi:hypothetical protein
VAEARACLKNNPAVADSDWGKHIAAYCDEIEIFIAEGNEEKSLAAAIKLGKFAAVFMEVLFADLYGDMDGENENKGWQQ